MIIYLFYYWSLNYFILVKVKIKLINHLDEFKNLIKLINQL